MAGSLSARRGWSPFKEPHNRADILKHPGIETSEGAVPGGVSSPADLVRIKKAAGIAAGLSMLLPFFAALLYVRSFGVEVFHADEWDFVSLLKESARGTLGVTDLLAHHNEHVYLAPWGVMLLLGRLTEYATVPLMYLVVACLLGTTAAVYRAYASSAGRTPLALLLFVPVPLLVFSFRQHENMLWGNQISFAFAQTFSVLALCLLASRTGHAGRLAFPAALCATVASCSGVPGLLAWPSGLLLLLLQFGKDGAPGRAETGAWVVLGAAVWGAYLVGFEAASPASSFVLGHPEAGAEYLLTLSGASLFWSEGAALAAGALLILVAAASVALAIALGRVRENAFWISLGAFSLMSLALIAAGRSGFGEAPFAQAMLSRYTAFSIPGVVALYGLLVSLATNARSRAAVALMCVVLAAMLAGVLRSYQFGIETGRAVEDSRQQAARILLAHEAEPLAAFTIFGHDPRRVQAHARFLDRHDYSTFAVSGPEAGGKATLENP